MSRLRSSARPDETYATLLLAFSVVIWGITPRMTAVGGPHAEPLTLTMLRAVPTALVLLLALPVLRYELPRGRTMWLWTAVSGLLMVTVFLAGFTEAIIKAGPGNAIVLATTTPFWVILINRFLYKEKVSLQTLGGLVIGFAGVVLIVSSQLGGAGGTDLVIGLLFALAAAIGWAAGTIVVKELVIRKPDIDFLGLTTGQYIIGGLALLAISLAVEGPNSADWSSTDLWLSVAFVSIVGSALATLAYFGALRRLSATRVTTWAFLSPVVAVILEIILGHTPEALVLVGMALTVGGVAIVTAAPRESEPVVLEPAEELEGS
jgi:drug/metabolite transporter (DMT)-like permease